MASLDNFTDDELRALILKKQIEYIKLCQDNFLIFVRAMWPDFICRDTTDPDKFGHHQIIANEFESIATGKHNRLIVNMPPRHTKSEFASYLFPAWMIGRNPKMKLMQVSHNAELATRFGSKVRNLMETEDYKSIFGDVKLREDSKAKGRWETNHGGEYFAAGVGGSITGRGADLLIIDDPHTEQDSMSDSAMDRAFDWYSSGPRQRLQPGGSIVVVMTRWATDDLTGRLIKSQSEPKSDKWRTISFPAILESGNPVWPEYWKLEELESVKASVSTKNWNAQYMQDPTSEEGAIIKRDWWQDWEFEKIPALKHVIQSYDTAFSKKETADYSAITTWGIFQPAEGYEDCIILLDAMKGRYDFPDLKNLALEQYKYWQPETVIIEAKATGQPLIHELRKAGIPVIDYVPAKGRDKHTRINSVAPVFESAMVYAPLHEKFAQEVIEECAAFPNGQYDDYVDSMTQAVIRFRQGGFISTYTDELDAPNFRIEKEHKYYG
tara:strand:- start:9957 stop:11441 length:1485 start_codon:yes stop_codon:yes gene_type:complete